MSCRGAEKPSIQLEDLWKVGAIAPASIAATAIDGQAPRIEGQ